MQKALRIFLETNTYGGICFSAAIGLAVYMLVEFLSTVRDYGWDEVTFTSATPWLFSGALFTILGLVFSYISKSHEGFSGALWLGIGGITSGISIQETVIAIQTIGFSAALLRLPFVQLEIAALIMIAIGSFWSWWSLRSFFAR